MKKKELYGRYGARFSAVQALYEYYSTEKAPHLILMDYEEHHFEKSDLFKYKNIDIELFNEVFKGVIKNQEKIENVIAQSDPAKKSLKKPELLLECIIKAGVFELLLTPLIPKPVILNEYINMTKEFFQNKEPQLVNAILDKIVRPSSEEC